MPCATTPVGRCFTVPVRRGGITALHLPLPPATVVSPWPKGIFQCCSRIELATLYQRRSRKSQSYPENEQAKRIAEGEQKHTKSKQKQNKQQPRKQPNNPKKKKKVNGQAPAHPGGHSSPSVHFVFVSSLYISFFFVSFYSLRLCDFGDHFWLVLLACTAYRST